MVSPTRSSRFKLLTAARTWLESVRLSTSLGLLTQTRTFEMSQHHVKELQFIATSEQARSKCAQDRKIKSGIAQFEGQCLLPLDALLNGLGGLPICQALDELEDTDQSEPPRGTSRVDHAWRTRMQRTGSRKRHQAGLECACTTSLWG
jgi:hypothetical protein